MEGNLHRRTGIFSGDGPISDVRSARGPQEIHVDYSSIPNSNSTSPHSLIGPAPPDGSARLRRSTSSRNTLPHPINLRTTNGKTFGTLSPDLFASMSGSKDMITGLTPTQRPSRAKKGKRVHNCTHPGCEKIFTRAEHLRRHQLNHSSDVLYRCDSCDKRFVRQDLLNRHTERHATPAYRVEHNLDLRHSPGAFSDASSTVGGSDVEHGLYDPSLGMYAPHSPGFLVSGPMVTSSIMAGSVLSTSGVSDSFGVPSFPAMHTPYDMHGSRTPSPSQMNFPPRSQHYAPSYYHRPRPHIPVPSEAILPSDPLPTRTWEGGIGQLQVGSGSLELPLPNERELGLGEGYQADFESRPRKTNAQGAFHGIDDSTRTQLLYLVGQPDSAAYFETTLEAMNGYLGTFWRSVHQVYPVLHQASFEPSRNLWLTAMVIAHGASLTSNEGHRFAINLYEKIREYTNTTEFRDSYYSNIYLQQTLLLGDIFAKTRLHNDSLELENTMAMKLSELLRQAPIPNVPPSGYASRLKSKQQSGIGVSLEMEWNAWIMTESRRRIVAYFMVWDAQQALMFGVGLLTTAQIRARSFLWEGTSQWPCEAALGWYANQTLISKDDHALWTCETPASWFDRLQQPYSERRLVDVLQQCIDPAKPFPELYTGETTLALYGLGLILVDYLRTPEDAAFLRDITNAKMIRLMQSFNRWKAYFYKEVRRNLSPISCQRLLLYLFLPQVHATTDLDMLRYAAGDSRITTEQTRTDAERNSALIKWATSSNGKKAVAAAVEYVSKTLSSTRDLAVEPQLAWGIYIATLICWGYEEFSTIKPPGSKSAWNPEINAMEYISGMSAYGPLSSAIPPGGTHSSSGLIVYSRSLLLNNRWGLLSYSSGILSCLAEARGIYIQR